MNATAPQSRFDVAAFVVAPLACLGAAALAAACCGPEWTSRAGPVPWLLSLVVIGLPHGAADFAAARRVCGWPATVRMGLLYTGCIGLVFAIFMVAPLPLIAVFALVSVWHFGMAHADGQLPPVERGVVPKALAACARGGLVLGVPMACWPAETADVVAGLVRLMRSPSPGFSVAAVQTTGIGLAAAALACFAVEAARSARSPAGRRRTLETAGELAVFAALGAVADPLFSVGMYFLCWHAWRHMRFLAPVVTGEQAADAPALARAVARVHVAALPLLVPTMAVLLVAWWWLAPGHAVRDLAILSLAVYLVVTPSHDLLIDFFRSRAAAAPASTATIHAPCAVRSTC